MISVSGHFMNFILKMCQSVASINVTNQFHDFFNIIVVGFLTV